MVKIEVYDIEGLDGLIIKGMPFIRLLGQDVIAGCPWATGAEFVPDVEYHKIYENELYGMWGGVWASNKLAALLWAYSHCWDDDVLSEVEERINAIQWEEKDCEHKMLIGGENIGGY